MNPFLIRTTIATIVALIGGILGATSGRYAASKLPLLVYTAMGALLAVTLFDILPDAKSLLPWPFFLGGVLSGWLLFWLVSRFIFQICPACSIGSTPAMTAGFLTQTLPLIVVALAIHSTMDGLAVVIGDEVTLHPNWAVLLAISFHKLPEGLALALLLLGGGFAPLRALMWTCGIELTTELGGLIGVYGVHHFSTEGLGVIFSHVGGGFLYLVGSTFQSFAHGGAAKVGARPLLFGSSIMFMVTSLVLWTVHLYAH